MYIFASAIAYRQYEYKFLFTSTKNVMIAKVKYENVLKKLVSISSRAREHFDFMVWRQRNI